MKVVAIGEVLWDIIGHQEFLGGAPLNLCANLQRCGHDAMLLSSVGHDRRGQAAREALELLSLSAAYLQESGRYGTGTATVTKDLNGEHTFQITRPAAYDDLDLSSDVVSKLADEAPGWLYFGTLIQTSPEIESQIASVRKQLPAAKTFYDMNLRVGHWSAPLVRRICEGVTILKLNEVEAAELARSEDNQPGFHLERFCEEWASRFGIEIICVTLGAGGCCVFMDGSARRYPGFSVQVNDTVGAGDAFAAAFLHGFDQAWSTERCAQFANALGALVASRAGATPGWNFSEMEEMLGRTSRIGGQVE